MIGANPLLQMGSKEKLSSMVLCDVSKVLVFIVFQNLGPLAFNPTKFETTTLKTRAMINVGRSSLCYVVACGYGNRFSSFTYFS